MRAIVLLLAFLVPMAAQAGEVTVDFDDVASGTIVGDRYADLGIRLVGLGNGGPFGVEAKQACVTPASPPNAIATSNLGACPEFSKTSGFVRATFERPQPSVSIMVTHVDPTATSFLRVYRDGQFLDQRFGDSRPGWVGLPQKIEIARQPGDPWITEMEFGAYSGAATFDDLHFVIGPVATATQSWGLVKARY